ncbi:hypothetical protein KC343_g15782 [Hortaea werneckii]|nr:hypothetical protein KC338_g7841 [Hortaea werneckii]KAI6870141.1 hypothetical protein KC323_g2404 [Hortaea werneckii]KAI7157980.1 hypothetical protein KC352_g27310 [Hortaea werneckii]KAI7547493.1 hypothetical protein KC317_g15106 [Hortaea werneckii]KAI7600104.1 hypothetical protein KC343_g15782 [Hortaea werneckii]
MEKRASITIYHSCDAPATHTLHHFKKGTLKRPRSNQDFHLPLPTEKVNIPRRHGILETVLRCAAPYCKDCAATEYEGNELTLTVAKSHGITGVNLRPSRTAKTATERLQDGLERGKWIFSREAPTFSSNPEISDRTQRFASFHPQAAGFARVLAFLRGVPMEVEISDSTPRGNYFEASEKGAEDVPGLPPGDSMPVGAFYGDFGKATGSMDEGITSGNEAATRYHRSSHEEVVKPGQKERADLACRREARAEGNAGCSLAGWELAAYTATTTTISPPPPPSYASEWKNPAHQQPPTFSPIPIPMARGHTNHFDPSWIPASPAPPPDPNIMPTPPVAEAASAFAEDLALNFANGLVADKRLLEDAGLVAQGRRKKVRV